MSNQAHITYTYHIILSYTKNASFKGRFIYLEEN